MLFPPSELARTLKHLRKTHHDENNKAKITTRKSQRDTRVWLFPPPEAFYSGILAKYPPNTPLGPAPSSLLDQPTGTFSEKGEEKSSPGGHLAAPGWPLPSS